MIARAVACAAVLASVAMADEPAAPVAPASSEPVAFTVEAEEPLTLEGELHLPQRPTADTTVPGVVICHPHPLYGGTMHNVIVIAMRDQLLERGIATLQFNFRGVGESEGEHDDGRGEVNDVLAALRFLRSRPGVDVQRCGLAAYSFGADMALRACARDEDVPSAACVGLPTGHEPVTVDEWAHLARVRRPLLLVTGSEDQYSSIPNVQTLVEHYDLRARTLPIEDADHFYADAGKRRMMAVQVAQFLAMHLIGEL